MNTDVATAASPQVKQQCWPWFFAGFLVTFVALALFKTVHWMRPQGDAVVAMKLWQLYQLEWPRIGEPQALGPATVNQQALMQLTLTHLAVSTVVGLFTFTIVKLLFHRRVEDG